MLNEMRRRRSERRRELSEEPPLPMWTMVE
jgi:hypothetical protein